MIIYVRSKKDKDAISHLIKKKYEDVVVKTLGGVRKEKLLEKILEITRNPEDYTVILLGREDRKWIKEDFSTPIVKVGFVQKARVRNVKLKDLLWDIEALKFRFILDVFYDKEKRAYILGKKSNLQFSDRIGDIFLLDFEKYRDFIGLRNPGLVYHYKDLDIIFSGEKIVMKVFRPIDGNLKIIRTGLEEENVDIEKTYDINKEYLKQKLEFTIRKIKRVSKDFDEFVVPWSGGKDSTAILILLKRYTNIKFTAVFVNTGLEFHENVEYIENVSKKLGIKYEEVYAGIDKEYKILGYSYLADRRCTIRKITTLYNFIRSNFENPLIFVGDRIAESEIRSFRAELRKDEFWVYTPLKYWSYFDEQLLFKFNNLPLNPLYEMGFYRLGCTICPFIDVLEKEVIKRFELLK